MFENVAQQMIYGHLAGEIGCSVYDTVPFQPEAAPATSFPYCVIGEDTGGNWSTDDTVGGAVMVTLHFWSRASGFREVKSLMANTYQRLNRAVLTADGFNATDCLWQFSTATNDPDGQTKHGVQRYRLTIHEV